MAKYKKLGSVTLFDAQNTKENLSELGNPLERLSQVVDFEMFRKALEDVFENKAKKNNAGAKPYDVVMMFKVMIIKHYYNLSDHQVQYQITDRQSFKDFLGLASGDKVPDEKTIWAFSEKMAKSGLSEKLFQQFVDELNEKGLIFNEGQIIDASFVLAPKQHNTRDENKDIKNGKGGDLWNGNSNKKRQKDIDARWTQKGGQNYFGYKNHIKMDKVSKFIKKCLASTASLHDSQALDYLLDETDHGQPIYADSAYVGQCNILAKWDMIDEICEKGYRNHPLTEEQKESNRKKSSIRSRVEHVFGFEEGCMNRLATRAIGFVRTKSNIFLKNLIYNFCRLEQTTRLGIN